MRIAIVTPYVGSVLGNRGAFVLARALARDHEVVVVADVVSAKLLAEVQSLVAPARFEAISTAALPPVRMSRLMWLQLVRGTDRAIAHRLLEMHLRTPLDLVFVRSDEGHWIGEYIRKWPGPIRPATLLGVLDLIDHPFLLRYARPSPVVRALAGAIYPWLHWIENRRLRAFDGIVTNSRWTSTLLGYLYGLSALGEVDAYDDDRFQLGPEEPPVDPYIAVPTASLDPATIPWIERLAADGVPLRLYGPRPAGQVRTAGFLGDADMADLLRRARATLFLFDYEAFGLIPVESLAVGTPVITQPKGGPYSEHRNNPNVHFVVTYPEVRDACRRLVAEPKTAAVREACHQSVEQYRPARATAHLLVAIDSIRSRPPSGS